jgi:uncharacterized protein (DUF1330 family)
MATYVIGAMQKVNDTAGFAAYQQAAIPTIGLYGGKLIVGSTKIEVADGKWSPVQIVIGEFESLERAKAWYYGPEYQAVVGQRIQSTDSTVIFVDGD